MAGVVAVFGMLRQLCARDDSERINALSWLSSNNQYIEKCDVLIVKHLLYDPSVQIRRVSILGDI